MFCVGATGAALHWWSRVTAIRDESEQVSSAQCKEGQNCDEKSVRLQARELVTAEATADLAFYQLLLSFAGVVGLGFTVYYAHKAWLESERSADAAHRTLEDARTSASEQAERFREEIETARANVEAVRQAAISADRPWLTLSVRPTSALIFRGDDVLIEVECVCKNIGRSPAINIVWDWGMFPTSGDAYAHVTNTTQARYFSANLSLGHVLFPEEVSAQSVVLKMDRKSFIDACAKFGSDPETMEEFGATLCPIVVVGVQYAIPGDQRRRFTYMSYFIRRIDTFTGSFDGSECEINRSLLEMDFDGSSNPIT